MNALLKVDSAMKIARVRTVIIQLIIRPIFVMQGRILGRGTQWPSSQKSKTRVHTSYSKNMISQIRPKKITSPHGILRDAVVRNLVAKRSIASAFRWEFYAILPNVSAVIAKTQRKKSRGEWQMMISSMSLPILSSELKLITNYVLFLFYFLIL